MCVHGAQAAACWLLSNPLCAAVVGSHVPLLRAAKFQAQQSRQAEGGGGGAAGEAGGTGSPRLSAQQRLSSMGGGGGAAMSAAAPSDVTGICGTGYYISVRCTCAVCACDSSVESCAVCACDRG